MVHFFQYLEVLKIFTVDLVIGFLTCVYPLMSHRPTSVTKSSVTHYSCLVVWCLLQS